MACFVVPTAEAIITTIAARIIKSKEKEGKTVEVSDGNGGFEQRERIPFSRKIKWLSNLLWGGSVLLAFEHLWHGEIVPWFPFLTAVSNPEDLSAMLYEMATAGVAMALLATAIWVGMLVVSAAVEKRALKPQVTGR